MHRNERDLLDALKLELKFLDDGGYARSAGTSWRPVYIFEDSPNCVNRDYEVNPASCGDCQLMQLVPPAFRSAMRPCRHIPLNAAGETLDLLYRYADEHQIEETVRNWLQATIARLEGQTTTQLHGGCECAAMSGKDKKGTALEAAKCANPACPVSFDWHKDGTFFLFRQQPSNPAIENAPDGTPAGASGVKHFWLCRRCAHIFTLAYRENTGVVLRVRPELADPETEQVLTEHGS